MKRIPKENPNSKYGVYLSAALFVLGTIFGAEIKTHIDLYKQDSYDREYQLRSRLCSDCCKRNIGGGKETTNRTTDANWDTTLLNRTSKSPSKPALSRLYTR